MARTTGPLMSMEASGTLAKTLVFSRWKGRAYVRRWTIPANPKAPLQVSTRSMMTFLSQQWAAIGSPAQDSWAAFAESLKISPFNAYIRGNQKAFANFDPVYQATPPAAALAPDSNNGSTATVDNKLVTLDLELNALINDWGAIFCVSPNPVAACTRGLVAGVAPFVGVHAHIVLGPLASGTYHFNSRGFTTDGVWGPDQGDVTFVVT